MRFNRKVLASALGMGIPIEDGFERGIGKSTSAILRALAHSYDCPGVPQVVYDPDCTRHVRAHHLAKDARELIERLRFEGFDVRETLHPPGVTITNNWTEVLKV